MVDQTSQLSEASAGWGSLVLSTVGLHGTAHTSPHPPLRTPTPESMFNHLIISSALPVTSCELFNYRMPSQLFFPESPNDNSLLLETQNDVSN